MDYDVGNEADLCDNISGLVGGYVDKLAVKRALRGKEPPQSCSF